MFLLSHYGIILKHCYDYNHKQINLNKKILGNVLKVCLAVQQDSLLAHLPGNTMQQAHRLSSTVVPERVPCCPLR